MENHFCHCFLRLSVRSSTQSCVFVEIVTHISVFFKKGLSEMAAASRKLTPDDFEFGDLLGEGAFARVRPTRLAIIICRFIS